MPGPHLAFAGQHKQLVVERVEDAARSLALLDREVWAGDVANEQRVAAEHRPRVGPARVVDQRERGVLGTMTGGVERADRDVAEPQLPAVVEWLVLVVGLSEPVDVDRRARRGGQASVAGDVVGVVVGLEHVLDPDAHVTRQGQVFVDLELRVDDGDDAGVLVPDQIGRAAKVIVGELTKDHRAPLCRRARAAARLAPTQSRPL